MNAPSTKSSADQVVAALGAGLATLSATDLPIIALEHVGEHVIRSHLGARYPDPSPLYEAVGYDCN